MLKRFIKKIIKRIKNSLKAEVPVNIPVMYGELLKGRTAFITGGTGGIGFAIAQAFLNNGASVVITGRTQGRIDSACQRLRDNNNGGTVSGVVLDNLNVPAMEKIFTAVTERLGSRKIDIFVNNAGVINKKSFGNTDEQDYDLVLDTDLKGPYFLSQIVAKYMTDNKIHGNILNVASSSSLRPATSSYELAKWGIRGFTMGLAKRLSPEGIVVNGIAPGPTATEMLLDKDEKSISRPSSPSGRYATVEEIANLSVILVSSLGRMVNGDIIYATGGCGLLTYDDWK